jgi:GAF domain-containing protein
LPCDGMAVFVHDERSDVLMVEHAAGVHAQLLRTVTQPRGSGIAGWVAVNRRIAVNSDPALDLGIDADRLTPALRSCLALPLIRDEEPAAVLSLYSAQPNAYSEDHVRLTELLMPQLVALLRDRTAAEETRQSKPAAGRKLQLVVGN